MDKKDKGPSERHQQEDQAGNQRQQMIQKTRESTELSSICQRNKIDRKHEEKKKILNTRIRDESGSIEATRKVPRYFRNSTKANHK